VRRQFAPTGAKVEHQIVRLQIGQIEQALDARGMSKKILGMPGCCDHELAPP